MALSSSVQFKSYLCNQVDDIAGNDVCPTKQAIRQRQGTKTPSVTERRKNLERNQAQFVPTAAKSDCEGSTGSRGLFPMDV